MSDEIVIMKDGAVEQAGGPRALYSRPATRFVGSFLGDCNYFPVNGREYAVRPEVMRIGAEATGLDHVFNGLISDVVFLGGSQRLVIQCADRRILAVNALRGEGANLTMGAPIQVGFALRDGAMLDGG